MDDAFLLITLFVYFVGALAALRWMGALNNLTCALFRHRFEVVRVLKPWLHVGVHWMLGCDLKCTRCGRVALWEDVEKSWHADFLASGSTPDDLAMLPGVDHPNHLCPCETCCAPEVFDG